MKYARFNNEMTENFYLDNNNKVYHIIFNYNQLQQRNVVK